ncbi:MAG: N-acetylneuraminate synthase family protein [Promethearchaeota archaeon]
MTYIISEISNQWGGEIEIAEQMILQSKLAGANAVKIQLFDNQWKPERYNKQLKQDYLSFKFEDVVRLKKYAEMLHIDFFASPLDIERLSWCIKLNLSFIKIGNGIYKQKKELVNKAIATGKKIIISLDNEEIKQGCPNNNKNIIYLYTERKYPVNLEDIKMPNFENSFVSGYSDHAIGLSACLYALSKGAKIIEKHFTISKSWQKTGESAHIGAMNYHELLKLRAISRDFNILKHGKILEFEKGKIKT